MHIRMLAQKRLNCCIRVLTLNGIKARFTQLSA